MRLEQIAEEIVKRTDSDFSEADIKGRAESYFKSSMYALLSNPETNLSEMDYHSLVQVVRLEYYLSKAEILHNAVEDMLDQANQSAQATQQLLRNRGIFGNCAYPSHLQYVPEGKYLRLLSGYHFVNKRDNINRRVVIHNNLDTFNTVINNPHTKHSNDMNVCLIDRKLAVFPFHNFCNLKYIKIPDDSIFVADYDFSNDFSMRFIFACIEMAVEQLKRELGVTQ